MPAAYAFGRGRKGPSGRGTGGDGGAGLRGLRGRENFFDFFVDRGAAFWQCVFLPRGCSSVGRALEWHSRGQEFNSPQLHQKGNQGLRKRRPFFRFWPRKSGSAKPELSRAPAFSYPAGRRGSCGHRRAGAYAGTVAWRPLPIPPVSPAERVGVCVRAHLIHAALLSYQERFLLVKKAGLC